MIEWCLPRVQTSLNGRIAPAICAIINQRQSSARTFGARKHIGNSFAKLALTPALTG